MTDPENAYFKIKKRLLAEITICVLIIIVLALLALPVFSDYTDRSRVADIFSRLGPVKQSIAEVLLSNPQGMSVSVNENLIPENILQGRKAKNGEAIILEYKNISETGEITLLFSGLNLFLQLTPSVENGQVSWSCYGRPEKHLPAFCNK